MLGRIGARAAAMMLLIWSGTAAMAQKPLLLPDVPDAPATAASQTVSSGAIEESDELGGALIPVNHSTSCNFDPYAKFEEQRNGTRHAHLGKRIKAEQRDAGDGRYCDFECANCYNWWDVEKRIFVSYAHLGPQHRATQVGYGDANKGQVGMEVVPWVITDGADFYSRWGWTTMFDYSNYEGFKGGILQSKLSKRQLSVTDGVTYAFVVGPTVRMDFELLGIRMSPNITAGLTFDWTTMSVGPPTGQVDRLRRIDTFKYAGFDVGGYFRFMWDFPITRSLNVGVGLEYQAMPTDVLVNPDEWRKQCGVVLGISHRF